MRVTTPKRKPGRPKAEPTTPISVRLNKAQHAAYIEAGGARWLKRIIEDKTLDAGQKSA